MIDMASHNGYLVRAIYVNPMEIVLDPDSSVLVAQVGSAEASHTMDTEHLLLRGKHFPGPSKVVYLGDVATALMGQLSHPDTPQFLEPTGFNEQRWTIETTSGDLKVRIDSKPYWAFGLFTSGYLNVIRLEGPLHLRARLIFDTVSSLGHHPWEFAHWRSLDRFMKKHTKDITSKTNEELWKNLVDAARQTLSEQIASMGERADEILKLGEGSEDVDAWQHAIEDDLHMAKRALAEDNGPGVERALARLEASLIQLDPRLESTHVEAPSERFATDLEDENNRAAIAASTTDLDDDESIPFVDLSSSGAEEEEQ